MESGDACHSGAIAACCFNKLGDNPVTRTAHDPGDDAVHGHGGRSAGLPDELRDFLRTPDRGDRQLLTPPSPAAP